MCSLRNSAALCARARRLEAARVPRKLQCDGGADRLPRPEAACELLRTSGTKPRLKTVTGFPPRGPI
ncbi:hypothetical protein LG3211_1595 [Lysobacter gummosus]|nr:hypothetical protein LG3211_1595 [Lysobacter gummosus]